MVCLNSWQCTLINFLQFSLSTSRDNRIYISLLYKKWRGGKSTKDWIIKAGLFFCLLKKAFVRNLIIIGI